MRTLDCDPMHEMQVFYRISGCCLAVRHVHLRKGKSISFTSK